MSLTVTGCDEYLRLSRRRFLSGGLQTAAALALQGVWPAWLPQIALADPHVGPRGDTLVCLFLRGGADGLNIVVPHGEEAYYAQRPQLNIPRPDDAATLKALDLDGFFGLHPALSPLLPLYQAGDLALIHATGAPDESRSHFVAQALMEQGVSPDYTGWLARHLATLDTQNTSPVRAIGIGETVQMALLGPAPATLIPSVDGYQLAAHPDEQPALMRLLQNIYAADPLAGPAGQTLAALALMEQVRQNPGRGVVYPSQPIGQALQTVAQLIHAEAGVEVACVNHGGWDTHAAQGGTAGQMANLLTNLGEALRAFYEDLGDKISQVTLVVMSEFGRRAAENNSGGTDHGHGNVMFLLGGGVQGGRVVTQWPGLEPEQLVGTGDLAITIDYRDILGEIVHRRLNNPRLTDVFPGYTITERGLVQPHL